MPQQDDHLARLSPLEVLTIPSYRAEMVQCHVGWRQWIGVLIITGIISVWEGEVGRQSGVYLLYVVARNID